MRVSLLEPLAVLLPVGLALSTVALCRAQNGWIAIPALLGSFLCGFAITRLCLLALHVLAAPRARRAPSLTTWRPR